MKSSVFTSKHPPQSLEYFSNSLLIHARAFRASDFTGMVNEVRARCPMLRETIELESGWAALLEDGRSVPQEKLAAREASLDPDDAINIQYTSGTTGFPKGATLSHRNILNNGYFIGEALRYSPRDRVCIPVPFYHCFGMVLAARVAFSSISPA